MKKQKTIKQGRTNPNEVVVVGIVEEAFANAMFRVRLENNHTVMCTICGRIRKTKGVRILLGDKVSVGVSIFDMGKGRILYRYI